MDTRRRRVGSASAFMTRDRPSAWAAVSGSRNSGAQQRAAMARSGADGLEAAGAAAADDLLTWLVCLADIDVRLYLVACSLTPAAPETPATTLAAAVTGLVLGLQVASDPPVPRAALSLRVAGRGHSHPDGPRHHGAPWWSVCAGIAAYSGTLACARSVSIRSRRCIERETVVDGYIQDWLERQHGPASDLDLAVLLINSLDNLEDPPDRLTSVDWFCSVTAQV